LTIETRPDYGMLKHGNEMLKLGCTRVELGVQSVFNFALKNINRGHSVEDSIESTKILKDLGFKINYHMMLGLPGIDKKRDLLGLQMLFALEDFQPDMLKLYPCMVLKGTKLYNEWKKKKFKPLTTKKAASLIAEFKKDVPPYVRIMRVQRDIPTFMTEAGVDKTNLRQYVDKVLKEKKIKCHCIRCREIGRFKGKIDPKKIVYKTMHYNASDGNEFFIAAEYNDWILGFCRARIPSSFLRKEITEDSILIRELHVYGSAVQIGKKGKIQHKGIGKKLLRKVEEIAKTYYKNKIVVISGIGVKEYYKKQGYKKEGVYMVKKI
jgi:elongator complex protein 3